jgi:hypothetical protein
MTGDITQRVFSQAREYIPDTLAQCERSGIPDLIKFLADSDFYTAPCSTKFHLACPGGLADHTWNVMNCAASLNQTYGDKFSPENIVLAAVGHDLCKVNFYKEVHENPTDPQMRYLTSLFVKAGLPVPKKLNKAYAGILIDFMLNTYKKSEECVTLPPFQHNYVITDEMPLGHGEKSLFIIQQFIKLNLDEMLAIRWHMGGFTDGLSTPCPSKYAYSEAIKKSKLVSIIALADMEASNLMEV